MRFYKLDPKSLEKELNTDFCTGLSNEQVKARSEECTNKDMVTDFSTEKLSFKFVRTSFFVFLSSLVYVLIAIFNKDIAILKNFFTIVGIYLFIYLIYSVCVFIQNNKVENSKNTSLFLTDVIRNGEIVAIDCGELLYGDVVLFKKGDYIPADAYLLESDSLVVDESGITSNSIVGKHVGIISGDNISTSEIFNTLYSGSYVVSGTAKAVITDVGSRMYISKTMKQKKESGIISNGIMDYSRLILLFFVLICSISTVISSLVNKNYFEAISLVLVFVAFFFSDILTKLLLLIFNKIYCHFVKSKIYFKNSSVVGKVNNSNLIIFDHNVILDGEISVNDFYIGGSIYNVSQLNKSNMDVFVYASLSCESSLKAPTDLMIQKLLKKVNVDFELINSLSPIVSHYSHDNGNFNICGRVYDDNNLLIAKGDYTQIFELCNIDFSDFDDNILKKLFSESTQVLGVAVKPVDIIPNDLSSQTDGFTFVGLIAVSKTVSSETNRKIKDFRKSGYKNVITFSGSEESAKLIASHTDSQCISCKDFINNDQRLLSDSTVVFGCSNYGEVVEKTVSNGYRPICFSSSSNNNKVVAVNSIDATDYSIKNADIVCELTLDNISKALNVCTFAYSKIKQSFINILVFLTFFAISFPIFSAVNNHFVLSPTEVILLIFAIIPCTALLNYKENNNFSEDRLFSSKPLTIKNTIVFLITSVILVIFALVLNAVFGSESLKSGVILMLTSFCPYFTLFNKKDGFNIKNYLAYLQVVLLFILFLTPVGELISIGKISVFSGLISILSGIFVRIINIFAVEFITNKEVI